jgi:glycosyltransferase involved in cell wall biosynthesis
MNIWLLQTGEPLPLAPGVRKMRTGLLADVLLARGHTIWWWVSAFEHQRKFMQFDEDQEIHNGNALTFRVLKGWGYKRNISLSRYLDHRIIARKFRIFSRRAKTPDGIVASLPCYHLAYEAVQYARERNIPVLVDVRDLWPDIFLQALPRRIWQKIGKIILGQDFFRVRCLLAQCDGILAISRGVLAWALNNAGRPMGLWDRVFFMGYKKGRGNPHKHLPWLRGRENQKLAVYVGTFGRSYELLLILEAARRFQEKGNDHICFVLAGTGDQAASLQQEAQNLSNVVLPGWIDSDEIQELLHCAWVGLVPCRSVVGALPNKIFEYLSAGLPVISSLKGEMAESVEKHGFGINYQEGDVKGLISALDNILENPDERDTMARNALSFFQQYGDADKIYKDYAEHIERLISRENLNRQ